MQNYVRTGQVWTEAARNSAVQPDLTVRPWRASGSTRTRARGPVSGVIARLHIFNDATSDARNNTFDHRISTDLQFKVADMHKRLSLEKKS